LVLTDQYGSATQLMVMGGFQYLHGFVQGVEFDEGS